MKKSIFRRALNKLRNKLFINPKMRKSQNEFIKGFLSHDADDFIEITNEVIDDQVFHKHLESEFNSVDTPYSIYPRHSWPVLNYYLIRKLKPEIIVETGVWHGISTAYILLALKANSSGKLFSIDLPAYMEEGGYKDLNPFDNNDIEVRYRL